MKIVYKNILPILLLFCIPSFGQMAQKMNPKYFGTYKTKDQKNCPISLVITSVGKEYHYKIKIKERVKEGRLKITKTKDEVYLTFTGLLQKKPKDIVEGQYIDNSVVIQNYGNAMNSFTVFSECNEKYIELLKEKKN